MPDKPGGRLFGRLLLVWAALAVVATAVALELVVSMNIRGDDALRLVQVRDLVAGQGWYDLTNYRIDPPGGVVTHWSRLVDVPIAAVLLALTPLVGAHAAEEAALVAVPLLTLGVVVGFIGWTAARLFDVRVAGFAGLSLGILVPVLFHLQPTRLDHHGWQLAAAAAAVAGLVARSGRAGAMLSGAAMAFGLTVSLEVLPLAAGLAGIFALRWLADDQARGQIAAYLQTLAAGLAVLFLIALGPANIRQYCDAIGSAHIAFLAAVAVAVTIAARRPGLPRAAIAGVLAGAGALGMAVFGTLAPECLRTPFGALDPVVHDYWYRLVPEGMPIWKHSARDAVPAVVQLAVALAATGLLARRSSGERRTFWLHYLALLGYACALGMAFNRSLAFAGVVAAVPLGWFIAESLRRLAATASVARRTVGTVLLVAVLMPSTIFMLADGLRPTPAVVRAKQSAVGVFETNCLDAGAVARLRALPRGEIFMPFDLGPTVLMRTDHSVTATGHHRAEAAMAAVIDGFRAPPDAARAIIAGRDADYVLACSEMIDTQVYARSSPNGLAARLLGGDAPEWLEPVPGFERGPSRVWRVVK